MTGKAEPVKIALIADLEKAPDLRTHVRAIDVDGVEAVEFRDFVVSTGTYGRGYWVPLSVLGDLKAVLRQGDIKAALGKGR